MHCGASEWIMAAVPARARLVDVDSELFVIGAMAFQFVPGAGSEGNAVAIVDCAACQLSRERIEARIVLRPLDAVLCENSAIPREQVLIVKNLVEKRLSEQ